MKLELYKMNSRGKRQLWTGELKSNSYKISFGQEGGKMQTKVTTVDKGKNIGKTNETTPEQQAKIELESTARKKIDAGYIFVGQDVELTTVNKKQVKTVAKDLPTPMLANDANKPVHTKKVLNKKVFVQPKLDGFRCIFDRKTNTLYSRSMKELIGVPNIVPFILEAVGTLPKTIRFIDGELCSDTLSFNEISTIVSAKKTIAPEEEQDKIKYYVFDYMSDDSFADREEKLRDNIYENDRVERVRSYYFEASSLEFFPIQKFIDEGYEGIMIRIPESSYENKRSMGLFKYKLFDDCEVTCIGFNPQENDDTKLGSLKMRMEDGTEFDARPAMTDEEKQEIWDNQDSYLNRIGTVKYQGLSAEYGVPRFPVFKFWRDSWDM